MLWRNIPAGADDALDSSMGAIYRRQHARARPRYRAPTPRAGKRRYTTNAGAIGTI